MKVSELVSHIQHRNFVKATQQLKQEGARLSNFSVSSPIFDLLKAWHENDWVLRNGGNEDKSSQKRAAKEMTALFEAMLDAGLPLEASLTKEQLDDRGSEHRERARLGLKIISYNVEVAEDVSLWVRFAGINWPDALDILRGRQEKWTTQQIDPEHNERWAAEIAEAVIQACEFSSYDALINVLDHHAELFFHKDQYPRLWKAVFKMDEPPQGLVNRILDKVKITDESFAALSVVIATLDHANYRDSVDPDLFLSWIEDRPENWSLFHNRFLQSLNKREEEEKKRNINSSLGKLHDDIIKSLFKRHVRSGQFSSLLDVAFSHSSLEIYADTTRQKTSLISDLIQGDMLNLEVLNSEVSSVLPQYTIKNQMRRTVKLIHRLVDHGFSIEDTQEPKFRSYNESWSAHPSESMKWAQKGFVPSLAFFHRHPDWAIENKIQQSPIALSADVETALAWERLGASCKEDQNGVNPWVYALSNARDSKKAPWANEIGGRLKKKTISLHALAQGGKEKRDLKQVMASCAPLVRTWIALSKKEPDAELVAGLVGAGQWVVLRQWFEQGQIQSSESRFAFLKELASVKNLTDASEKNHCKLLNTVKSLPDFPWPENAMRWKDYWTTKRHSTGFGYVTVVGKEAKFRHEAEELYAFWAKSDQENWHADPENLKNLFHICCNKENPVRLIPVQLDEETGFKFVNDFVLDEEASIYNRYKNLLFYLRAVEFDLPLHKLGEAFFEQLRKLDKSQQGNYGPYNMPEELKSFLEKEELKIEPVVAINPATRVRPRL